MWFPTENTIDLKCGFRVKILRKPQAKSDAYFCPVSVLYVLHGRPGRIENFFENSKSSRGVGGPTYQVFYNPCSISGDPVSERGMMKTLQISRIQSETT